MRIYIIENKEKQPFLISISEKIEEIIEQLRQRQRSVESTINELTKLAEEIAASKKEQEESELNKEEFSMFWILKNYGVNKPKETARKIAKDIDRCRDWLYNEKMEIRLRTELYKLLSQSYKYASLKNVGRDRRKPPYTKFTDVVNNILKIHRILVEEK